MGECEVKQQAVVFLQCGVAIYSRTVVRSSEHGKKGVCFADGDEDWVKADVVSMDEI